MYQCQTRGMTEFVTNIEPLQPYNAPYLFVTLSAKKIDLYEQG